MDKLFYFAVSEKFIETILFDGLTYNDTTVIFDAIDFLSHFQTPEDATALVTQIVDAFLIMPISEQQFNFLKGVLTNGLPDFEWTDQYNLYLEDTSEIFNKAVIVNRVKLLMKTLLNLPEFQLQ